MPSIKLKNAILLVASLVFYSWGEPKYVILMLLTSFIAFIGGLLIKKDEEDAKKKKRIYIIVTILILSALFVFKYLDFALGIFGLKTVGLALPIGISFYTFQVLSYVIDLYRGNVRVQLSYWRLLLYVSFFPQLIAGPIVRYSTVAAEIKKREHSLSDAAYGIKRFILGLAKKCLIANGVAKIAEIVYAGKTSVYGTFMYWIAAICYALQIYYDFSGYSDMAIGLGRIFGFHFLENFDTPYLADSVTDFWRRWHISLSSWFRDYVYIPLGGNRVGPLRHMFNILAVWALTGLWHGASWNFVIWGLYYAFFLIIEKYFLGKLLAKTKIVSHIYTLLIVVVGWVIFNLTDFAQMKLALVQMFSFVPTNIYNVIAEDPTISYGLIFIPLGILCLFAKPVLKKLEKKPILEDIIYIAVFLICVVFIVSSNYNPFIYFRF